MFLLKAQKHFSLNIKTVAAHDGTPVWRDGEELCAIADNFRHLGHIVRTDSWHAYDATKLNDVGDGFKYLGPHTTAKEAKGSVENSIAAAVRRKERAIERRDFQNNEQICRRLHEEAFANGNFDLIDAVVSSTCRFHDSAFPSLRSGGKNLKSHIRYLRNAFADLSRVCDDIIAERDEVVIHWTGRGVHRGDFLNFTGTNRPVRFSGTSIHRLVDGQIVELWTDWNWKNIIEEIAPYMSGHETDTRHHALASETR